MLITAGVFNAGGQQCPPTEISNNAAAAVACQDEQASTSVDLVVHLQQWTIPPKCFTFVTATMSKILVFNVTSSAALDHVPCCVRIIAWCEDVTDNMYARWSFREMLEFA